MERNYFKCKHEFGSGGCEYDDLYMDIQVELWFSNKEIPEEIKRKLVDNLNTVIGRSLEKAVEELMWCDNLPDVLGYLSDDPDEYPDFNEVVRFGGEYEDEIVLTNI